MRSFFISFLAHFLCFYGFTQTDYSDEFKYKVTYELTFQPDSTDIASRKTEDMYLYIGDDISRFSSAGKAIGDSLKSNVSRSGNNGAKYVRMRRQIPKTDFNYHLYKGIPTGKMTYATEVINNKYRYTENKDIIEWTISHETDTMLGFQVQKAATSFAGRNYTAWFTEEIPFPEGPYKFNGLPGLIVKITAEKSHYVFQMKEIIKLEEPIPFTFKEEEFTETTSKELTELQDEFKNDPIGFAKRALPGFNDDYLSKADKKRVDRQRKERLKKDNNPLELE